MFFGGNLDLHICAHKKDFEHKEIVNFDITKENEYLFDLFDKLYKKIIECQIYSPDPFKVQECKSKEEIQQLMNEAKQSNEYLRNTTYKELVQNGIISWACDDKLLEEANVLNIYKENDKYRLEFIQKDEEEVIYISVRIRNHRSRYVPFNGPFMELYNSLQDYEKNSVTSEPISKDSYQKRLNKN